MSSDYSIVSLKSEIVKLTTNIDTDDITLVYKGIITTTTTTTTITTTSTTSTSTTTTTTTASSPPPSLSSLPIIDTTKERSY